MANWIETKVRYEKTLENGMQKMVNEPDLVDALIFSEAETRITEEIAPYMQGGFQRIGSKENQYRRDILFRRYLCRKVLQG